MGEVTSQHQCANCCQNFLHSCCSPTICLTKGRRPFALLCPALWGTDSSRSAWKILTPVVGAKIATLKKAQMLEVLKVSYIHGSVPNNTEVTLWDVMWGRGGWVLLTPYMIEILVKSIRTIKIYEKKPNSHTNMLTTFCYKNLAWVWADSHMIIYKNIV